MQHYKLHEKMRQQYGAEQNQTNQYIINRARAALYILKQCDSEQQRKEYRVALTVLAPEQVAERDNSGMSRKVAEALGVNRSRALFTESVAERAEIDKLAKQHTTELQVGDSVVCRHTVPGGTSKLAALGPKGKCTVEHNMDGRVFTSEFKSMRSGSGGDRVRRPPIHFSPAGRKKRKDAVPEHTQAKILEHCELECPTSPCMKDRVRKLLGTGMYIVANCMILYTTLAVLFGSFQAYCPELFTLGLSGALSYKQYCKELPWQLRRVKRESCLCKPCENFGLYISFF